MSNQVTSSWRLKLDRAEEHLNALNADVDTWDSRHPYTVHTYPNAEGTVHELRVVENEGIPLHWGPLIGDFLYDLRSGLDNLVFQLIVNNSGGAPDYSEFPIFNVDSASKQHAIAKRLVGVPKASLTVFQDLQPYSRPHGDLPVEHQPLWLLHQLNRVDKHRLLHVVACLPEEGTFSTPDSFSGGAVQIFQPSTLEDGTILARIYPDAPLADMQMDGHLTAIVFIEETTETPKIAWGALDAMRDAVLDAFSRLERFL